MTHLLPEYVLACLPVCVYLYRGLQRLRSCGLFLGGVCFTCYSIFLLLSQSCDYEGCCEWPGEEQERGDGWEGAAIEELWGGVDGKGRKGMCNVEDKRYHRQPRRLEGRNETK